MVDITTVLDSTEGISCAIEIVDQVFNFRYEGSSNSLPVL